MLRRLIESFLAPGALFLGMIGVFPGLQAHASFFGNKVMVNGAGATFPYPLYSKWFSEYQKQVPDVAFNYQSIGSGGGIRQLLDETVDFGASDAAMSDEQLKKAKYPVLHVPATMGAVVLSYNLKGYDAPLRLTGDLVAQIFMGKITRWTDPKLVELNPQLKDVLRDDQDILVVHRSDGSGTTSIFSDFLSKSNSDWKTKVGKGSALRWPVGIGGKGNEGVTSFIQQIPGSIGYIELVFAKTLKLPVSSILNPKNEFIEPTPESVTKAAEGMLASIPDDFRTTLTRVDAKGAYPISSFSYLIVYPDKGSTDKKKPLFKFMEWALREGQKFSAKMNYAPLPEGLVKRVLLKVRAP